MEEIPGRVPRGVPELLVSGYEHETQEVDKSHCPVFLRTGDVVDYNVGDRVYYRDNGFRDKGTVTEVYQNKYSVVIVWDDGEEDEYNFGQIGTLPGNMR